MQQFNDTEVRSYRVSTSIGLMSVPASDTSTVDELLARVDELMYVDKKSRPAP